MGAGQSTNTGGQAADVETKTSYYELLGIEKQATEDEIKKAYRRKALELHPDRNYGNEESATKTFAEIQSAYEILSDPQERSWYDSHEQSILRGDDVNQNGAEGFGAPSGVTTADDLTRLVRKFNRNVEFTDSPSGFFGFIRETFEQLAQEEVAAGWQSGDEVEYPTFGHKDDDYGDVVKSFYAAWSGFSTLKSFSWEDRYRTSEAPDRFVRRRMEQENLRLRKDAKQEFNDAVRSLVAFVRKRDPRYVPNTQTEEERQKILRDATAAQAARARAANAAKMNEEVPEWTKVREPEELEESEEEEVEEEVIECVACSKTFKSEKSWEAHEKSKKHQKALRSLQHKMRKENAHLDLPGSDEETGVVNEEDYELIDDDGGEEQDLETLVNSQSDDQNEKDLSDAGNETKADIDPDVEDEATIQNEEEKDASKSTEKPDSPTEEQESEDSDYAPIEQIQARMQSAALDTSADVSDAEPAKAEPKMGKAAQKRAKRAAAAAAAEPNEQSGADASAICEVCKESFPSRTKLFQHVKDKNHAALKSTVGGKGKKGRGKR